MLPRSKVLYLFDVDGTLTAPMKVISQEMKSFLFDELKPRATIGLVGGSDFGKISKQMGGESIANFFDHVFSENGLIYYRNAELISSQSMVRHLGEGPMQKFINFCLKYMSDITLPVKRGNFIEFRTGMLNISPIGRSCSQQERDQFVEYDKEHKIRQNFVQAMKDAFGDAGLKFSIGGQISIDVFPVGWDKTYCLKHLEEHAFEVIHFFGDKTQPGGNDHEIYNDSRTIGHSVASPEDTKRQITELLKLN